MRTGSGQAANDPPVGHLKEQGRRAPLLLRTRGGKIRDAGEDVWGIRRRGHCGKHSAVGGSGERTDSHEINARIAWSPTLGEKIEKAAFTVLHL